MGDSRARTMRSGDGILAKGLLTDRESWKVKRIFFQSGFG